MSHSVQKVRDKKRKRSEEHSDNEDSDNEEYLWLRGRGGIDAEVKKLREAINELDSLTKSYQEGSFAIPEGITKEEKLHELGKLRTALEEWEMRVEGSINWAIYPFTQGHSACEKAVRAGLRYHGRVVGIAPQYIFDEHKNDPDGNGFQRILENTSSIFTVTRYLCMRVEREKENARRAYK